MATPVYFSTDASDISGYLKAYIGTRGPVASVATTVGMTSTTTSVVTTSTTFLAMTNTLGGSAAKWITAPVALAVTIQNAPFLSLYGTENNAATNAKLGVALFAFNSGTEGTVFLATSMGTELGTVMSRQAWSTLTSGSAESITATTLNPGDRLVLKPGIASVGAMAAGQVYFDFAGPTAGADGDSFVLFQEDFNAATTYSQYGTSASPFAGGPSVIACQEVIDRAKPYVKAALAVDARWSDIENELQAIENNGTA